MRCWTKITEDIRAAYFPKKKDITGRLAEFERKGRNAGEKEIFAELAFCLLTPQSKARVCWNAVERLLRKDILFCGSEKLLVGELRGVRFKYNKAKYIIEARRLLLPPGNLRSRIDEPDAREWLSENVRGMGYKEASHFLRNVGLGGGFAILDRHILKNLRRYGAIKRIPSRIGKKDYLRIEKKMKGLAEKAGIPLSHLDFVFWSKETGEIFK